MEKIRRAMRFLENLFVADINPSRAEESITPQKQLVMGIPLLVVIIAIVASFFISETQTKKVNVLEKMVDKLEQEKKLISRHHIVLRGTLSGEVGGQDSSGTYALSVLGYGGDAIIYACVPRDAESEKRKIARLRERKRWTNEPPLMVMGLVDSIAHEKRFMVLYDCIVFDVTSFR